jgi:aminopeptidase N
MQGQELSPSQRLVLQEQEQVFVFDDIPSQPVISTLRGYSAPVVLDMEQSHEELAVLMAHDSDAFNRWEASNRYYTCLILDLAKTGDMALIAQHAVSPALLQAVRSILQSVQGAGQQEQDLSLLAYALQLPDLMTLVNLMQPLDLDALLAARKKIQKALAEALQDDFLRVYRLLTGMEGNRRYAFNPREVGRRRLRNTCLDYLSSLPANQHLHLAKSQFDAACCMTDKLSALAALCSMPSAEREAALRAFYDTAQGQALVVNKWFSVQAMGDDEGTLARLESLQQHPDFTLSNPNRARSLYAVAASNIPLFHRADGKGYDFIAQAVLKLDAINPQVAARLASSFGVYKRLDEGRKQKVQAILQEMIEKHTLSPDTYEIVSRFLK